MSEPAPYSMLTPDDAPWRESYTMRIPLVDLGQALGARELGARIWRFPPYSASTWHKHLAQEELYYVLRGTGRMRVGDATLTVPEGGAVLVRPEPLRQVFNDTDTEVVWLLVGAPKQEVPPDRQFDGTDFYPEDPTQLPPELAGHAWPPAD